MFSSPKKCSPPRKSQQSVWPLRTHERGTDDDDTHTQSTKRTQQQQQKNNNTRTATHTNNQLLSITRENHGPTINNKRRNLRPTTVVVSQPRALHTPSAAASACSLSKQVKALPLCALFCYTLLLLQSCCFVIGTPSSKQGIPTNATHPRVRVCAVLSCPPAVCGLDSRIAEGQRPT